MNEAMAMTQTSGSDGHDGEPRSEPEREPDPDPATDTLTDVHLSAILESLIFVADKPVSVKQLARAARTRIAEVRRLVPDLMRAYEGGGVELCEVGGGYQFRTTARTAAFVRDFVAAKPLRLTRAQLESLAIIAYRQPVTRPEVDEIRGVDTGSSLKVLLDRGLVKILGRKDEPGRPLLYGTAPYFLEFFGLQALKDLPTLKEFTDLSEESRALFERSTGEHLNLEANETELGAVRAERGAYDREGPEFQDPDDDRTEFTRASVSMSSETDIDDAADAAGSEEAPLAEEAEAE
jgi:segregation and condensation protein B